GRAAGHRAPWRLQSGHDGVRRTGVLARHAALRKVSCCWVVRLARRRAERQAGNPPEGSSQLRSCAQEWIGLAPAEGGIEFAYARHVGAAFRSAFERKSEADAQAAPFHYHDRLYGLGLPCSWRFQLRGTLGAFGNGRKVAVDRFSAKDPPPAQLDLISMDI